MFYLSFELYIFKLVLVIKLFMSSVKEEKAESNNKEREKRNFHFMSGY